MEELVSKIYFDGYVDLYMSCLDTFDLSYRQRHANRLIRHHGFIRSMYASIKQSIVHCYTVLTNSEYTLEPT